MGAIPSHSTDTTDASLAAAIERFYRGQPWEAKTFVFHEIKTESEGRFSGYASAYARDLQGDKILPGAFGQTIADKKGKVPILYNHDDQRMPLGISTSLAEDGKGLLLNGRLFMGTSAGADAYEMLKAAADEGYRMGMSIGFIANDWDWDAAENVRSIKEIDLWEVSLTPFPAQPKAYVADVKNLRDFEKYLREAEHFSRADARKVLRLVADLNLSPRVMPGGAHAHRLLRGLLAQPETP
jgi:HK97 family phage prohead protease